MAETEIGGARDRFDTTLWTLVLQARDHSREALERLIEIYWKPLYFYVRRKGLGVEDAKDLVQGFFAAFVEKDFLKNVDADRGRFRSFLLACVQHHLADARDRERALKRGGDRPALSLDVSAAERNLPPDASARTPQSEYERAWAITVLERSLDALRREFRASGKEELFEALKAYVAAGGAPAYAEVATRLGMSESALRVAVHRARRRYGDLIREEVRRTVADDGAVEGELAELRRALE